MNDRSNPPSYINLNSKPSHPPQQPRPGALSPHDLPSPRAGDVPPALSPLDAFALQGRLLAQRLEAGNNNGHRMSRLPPLTIANALAQRQNGYSSPPQRSPSDQAAEASTGADGPPSFEVSEPTFRPRSHYPTISAFDDAESIYSRDSTIPTIKPVMEEDEEEDCEDSMNGVRLNGLSQRGRQTDRSGSPNTLSGHEDTARHKLERPTITTQTTSDSARSVDSSNASGNLATSQNLNVPRSPRILRDKPSIRSVSGDDSDGQSTQETTSRLDRRPSFGSGRSGHSGHRSPFSPVFAPPHSPSMSSEYSHHARTSINFSRPLSRAEIRPSQEKNQLPFDAFGLGCRVESPELRPSLDVLSLSDSINMDSPRLNLAPWMDSDTPLSLTDDERPYTPSGQQHHTSSRYALPRGRPPPKLSVDLDAEQRSRQPAWEPYPPRASNDIQQGRDHAGSVGTYSTYRTDYTTSTHDRGSDKSLDMTGSIPQLGPLVRTASANEIVKPTRILQSHRSNPSFPPPSTSNNYSNYSDTSSHSTHTLRAGSGTTYPPPTNHQAPSKLRSTSSNQPSPYSSPNPNTHAIDPTTLSTSLTQLTPAGHLAKGLACHENGQVQKSTYHLRLAAKGGDPTGMLMYALACRHGWGMRVNQEEGIAWLRRAVDCSGLVVAEDENPPHSQNGDASNGEKGGAAVVAAKRHKAQFACAVYELGQSYMHGWGIKADKTLALRCYELAGSWGDGDALTEAGWCYAKGVGVRKDLRRAAEYYRRADRLGVGGAGNSWIYKEKYMPPPEPNGTPTSAGTEDERNGRDREVKEKKPRDKSRTRTFFGGRKKSGI